MSEKCKSKTFYKPGTRIYDDVTGELFEVISCERIGVLDEFNWGLEIRELKLGDFDNGCDALHSKLDSSVL